MKQIPDWPCLMKRATLAQYLDIAPSDVEREIVAGRLPMPIKMGGRDVWSRALVDSMVERMTGEAIDNWRSSQPLYAKG
jgi:hypothetical protein